MLKRKRGQARGSKIENDLGSSDEFDSRVSWKLKIMTRHLIGVAN